MMDMSVNPAPKREAWMQSTTRLASIDCFRGFAVLVMVLATFLFGTEVLPAWLRHAPDGNITIVDLGAPLFIVAIGLTFGVSLQRRWARDGPAQAIWHFLRRALTLFAIGLAMAVAWTFFGLNDSGIYWGVLQAIAVAIMVALPFLPLPPLPRVAAGLALLAVYELIISRYWLDLVLSSPHGGLPGSLGWASLLILATACGDLLFRPAGRAWVLPAAGALAVAGALALSAAVPISKMRVSASYVLLALGTCVLLLWIFHLLVDRQGIRIPWLGALGKNPLLIYLLQYVLLAPFVLSETPWWYEQAPLWLAVVEAAAFVAAVIALARFLERRNWILSL
jgi:predicted acyltransferase